jgi:DNA polymerase-3 subunit beta
MTGVFFRFTPEAATFVATDAHRLVRYRRSELERFLRDRTVGAA